MFKGGTSSHLRRCCRAKVSSKSCFSRRIPSCNKIRRVYSANRTEKLHTRPDPSSLISYYTSHERKVPVDALRFSADLHEAEVVTRLGARAVNLSKANLAYERTNSTFGSELFALYESEFSNTLGIRRIPTQEDFSHNSAQGEELRFRSVEKRLRCSSDKYNGKLRSLGLYDQFVIQDPGGHHAYGKSKEIEILSYSTKWQAQSSLCDVSIVTDHAANLSPLVQDSEPSVWKLHNPKAHDTDIQPIFGLHCAIRESVEALIERSRFEHAPFLLSLLAFQSSDDTSNIPRLESVEIKLKRMTSTCTWWDRGPAWSFNQASIALKRADIDRLNAMFHANRDQPAQITAHVALGSNEGNSVENLELACVELAKRGIHIKRTSSLYTSKPMYYEQQALFVNAVCEVGGEMTGDLRKFIDEPDLGADRPGASRSLTRAQRY